MSKQDKLSPESGLNITEALKILRQKSHETFNATIKEIMNNSGSVVSLETAAHIAAKLVESMYKPIFGQIDPEEVGSRARAMSIGEYYGNRLNLKFENLKNRNSMTRLSRAYPSHEFVIDEREAKGLFKRIRHATNDEKNLLMHLE